MNTFNIDDKIVFTCEPLKAYGHVLAIDGEYVTVKFTNGHIMEFNYKDITLF
jgi:hypothetical protein